MSRSPNTVHPARPLELSPEPAPAAAPTDCRGRPVDPQLLAVAKIAATSRPDLEGLCRELESYVAEHEAWEREAQRLAQEQHALAARHWELLLQALERLAACETSRAGLGGDGGGTGVDLSGRMACYERALVHAALARANGCQRRAAKLLGVLPTTLNEKLKRLGLRAPNGN